MFFRIKYLSIMFLIGSWVTTANADLVDNGSTTIDTATGLEWLDLTETTGLSFNEVLNSAYVNHYGYRFATEEELLELYSNAGGTGTQGATASEENKAPAILLLNLVGCTSGLVGFTCDGAPEEWSPGMWGASAEYLGLIDNYSNETGILATRWTTSNDADSSFRDDVGAFLVRPANLSPVPTFSAFGISLMVLFLLLAASRQLGLPYRSR